MISNPDRPPRVERRKETIMTDRERDPHPDSPATDNHDERTDLERAVTSDTRDVERVEEDERTPNEPTVSPDSAGGAGGVVRNQDDTAQ
jgi:hypothetical protein